MIRFMLPKLKWVMTGVAMTSFFSLTWAQNRLLLVPLDDRPATGQFAQMIGSISGYTVELPPESLLGRFTRPGDPEAIQQWLESQEMSRYDGVILSSDMLLFGGLIASRKHQVSLEQSRERLQKFLSWHDSWTSKPLYVFSSLMRLAPTSESGNATYRENLRRLAIVQERLTRSIGLTDLISYLALANRVPKSAINDYFSARQRNMTLHQDLMRATARGNIDFLIVGQDDAQREGPQSEEKLRLIRQAQALGLGERIYFCEGIDQQSNMMISRMILKRLGWQPRVRIVLSDPLGAKVTPIYETSPVDESLKSQILASGAVVAGPGEDYDYSLFVNTPQPRALQFRQFLDELRNEIEQGFPVAVADINLGKTGTADPELYNALLENNLAVRLLSYAGWNTAGNTLGTAIPAANVYLAARKEGQFDPLTRELNQRAFLLHRLVNDFEYHRFTRPAAYGIIDQLQASRDEVYGEAFLETNNYVQKDIANRLRSMFDRQFAQQPFFAGNKEFVLNGIRRLDVNLPWPRAYEVKIGFELEAQEVRSR